MGNPLNTEGLYNSIMNIHNIVYPQKTTQPLQEDLYMDDFARNENSVKIIFDQPNLGILSVSDNVEDITGYTKADFYQADTKSVLQFLTFDHFFFPYVWAKWNKDIYETFGVHTFMKTSLCGVKVKHKNGHTMRLLIRYSAIDYFENGTIKTAAITLDDISHLVKSDFYWGRTEFTTDKVNIQHLFSFDSKYISNDIISEREKDVIRLISKGMESKEIADNLFLSSHTVDNHRRNMIARTGAKDTTALVQICKMCGVI